MALTDLRRNFYMDVAEPELKQDEAEIAREAYIQRLKNRKKKSGADLTEKATSPELSPNEQPREMYIQRLQRRKSHHYA